MQTEDKFDELLQFTSNDIREYLKFSVRVGTKACLWSHTILIDYSKRSKKFMLVILVPGNR